MNFKKKKRHRPKPSTIASGANDCDILKRKRGNGKKRYRNKRWAIEKNTRKNLD